MAQRLERKGLQGAMNLPFSMIAWHDHNARAEEADHIRKLAVAVSAGFGNKKAWEAL